MRLRAVAGEVDESLAEWWQEFSIATDEQREDLVAQVKEEQREQQKNKPKTTPAAKQIRSAPPKTGKTAAESPLDNLLERTSEEGDDAEPANTDPAKKRRRRKRGGAKKPNPAFVPNPTDGSSSE
jgi:poly(A) polymerase